LQFFYQYHLFQNFNSEQNDKVDQFLDTIKFEDDKFQLMLREFKSQKKKALIKLIRILIDCIMAKGRKIRIILCNEIDYLMFEFFAEVLIKIIV
jgi:hypothetical protein